jgi:hypothetical protein
VHSPAFVGRRMRDSVRGQASLDAGDDVDIGSRYDFVGVDCS